MGSVSSGGVTASTVVSGRRAIASRATDKWLARSPRLEPSATYATSRMAIADDGDFGVIERPTHGCVGLSDRDANALDCLRVENSGGDGAGQLLQVQELRRFQRGANLGIQMAI